MQTLMFLTPSCPPLVRTSFLFPARRNNSPHQAVRAQLKDNQPAGPDIGTITNTGTPSMPSLPDLICRSFDRAVAPIVRMSETRANHFGSLFADILVGVVLVWTGLDRMGSHPGMALLTFGGGLLLFTWVEYGFHRWLMHGPIPLLGPGHRKHHENPSGHDSMPFFLPPVIVSMLAGLFALVLPVSYALLLAGGLACGYAAYGLSHLIIHVRHFHHPLSRRWAASHHVHHYHPDANFGVTSPLWDIVLRTRYVSGSGSRVQR